MRLINGIDDVAPIYINYLALFCLNNEYDNKHHGKLQINLNTLKIVKRREQKHTDKTKH